MAIRCQFFLVPHFPYENGHLYWEEKTASESRFHSASPRFHLIGAILAVLFTAEAGRAVQKKLGFDEALNR